MRAAARDAGALISALIWRVVTIAMLLLRAAAIACCCDAAERVARGQRYLIFDIIIIRTDAARAFVTFLSLLRR